MQSTAYEGGCLCGWIRYKALAPVIQPHTCSCKTCQRHTGAVTAVWVEFAQQSVTWVGGGGVPSLFRSSDYSSRAFCSRCGSSVGAIDDDSTVALLVGGFDDNDLAELQPRFHAFEDKQPRWWCDAGTRSGLP